MPVPTHGENCKTRIWKTTCPECGDVVYFFSCTCGSKVYFDLREPPWNPHEERCIPYLMRYLLDVEQLSSTRLKQVIEHYSQEKGVPIPPDVQNRLLALEKPTKRDIKVVDVAPTNSEYIVLGQIESFNKQINFFNEFKIPDSSMGRTFLGKLLRTAYMKVILREKPDEVTRECKQFTCYVELKIFDRSRLAKHSRVFAVLNPATFANHQVWIAETLENE